MTTPELVPALKRALLARSGWSKARAEALVRALAASIASSWIDWDIGAGEMWARIMVGDAIGALVSIDLPLVIVRESLTAYVESDDDVEVVAVDDFDARQYEIDDPTAEALNVAVPQGQFNPRAFSVQELWWATV